ncbi:MAG: hypothetical protein WBQ09_13325 [Terriglobales bacterium]
MEAVLQQAQQKPLCGLGDLRALIGLPSKRSDSQLSVSVQELFKTTANVLDTLLIKAIEQRTAAEFEATRTSVFGDYWKTTTALSGLLQVILQPRTVDRLIWESFSELESEFKEQGLVRFGVAAKDQAVFTVWTLRKISRLLAKINASGDVAKAKKAADAKLASEFSFCATWTQFHMDCLLASIRFDKAITPEVLDEISEGLRAAVNAYGLVRQGAELRSPVDEPTLAPIAWDEEDQELLNSSMLEMESEVMDDGS